MHKKIKNVSGGDKVWCGQIVSSGEYYSIEHTELLRWQNDDKVIAAIEAAEAIMSDGVRDITDPVSALQFLTSKTKATATLTVDVEEINLNIFQKLSQLIWLDSRNIGYTNGLAIIEIEVPTGVGLQLRVIDATNNIVLGTSPWYTTSGIKTFAINNPSGDCRIEVQAKHDSILSLLVKPNVSCFLLEWDS